MPLFKYRASAPNGKVQELLIEGDSEADALARLRARGLTPMASLGISEGTERGIKALFKPSFNACEFSSRLSPLLQAHVPLEKALGIIADGLDEKHGAGVVNELRRGLHEGKKFSALIRAQGSRFPSIYANIVEAGEESGSLPEVVAELRRFLNERREMREFLITSAIYPVIVLTVTSGVVVLLFTVFIPRFSKIFIDMGKELPLPTKIMLKMSEFAMSTWWLVPIIIAGIIFLIRDIRSGGKSRAWWDRFSLRLPLIGEITRAAEMARFIRTLAVLTGRHVHLLDTIQIACRVLQNGSIADSFSSVAAELRGGAKLSKALGKSEHMPKTALQMIAIGEESGNLGGMLSQVADQGEEELRVKVKRLLALFEPAVILFLAVVILSVVISVFMAILQMNQI